MECLISVLYKAVNQVIVVDNGVNDDTDCVYRSEMRKHPDCRYNVGCGSTLTYFACTGQIEERLLHEPGRVLKLRAIIDRLEPHMHLHMFISSRSSYDTVA